MQANLVNEARQFVQRESSQGTIAVSAKSLAYELSCDENVATAILFFLQQEEQLVMAKGYVRCEICGQSSKQLEGSTIAELMASAERLAETPCWYCKSAYPEASDLDFRVSFFFLPR